MEHVPDIHWVWILPFVALLGCIAIMPLFRPKFWEHNYGWFALILGAITGVYYLFVFDDAGAPVAWFHEMREYVSFIVLLGSLYTVSGGVLIHISRRATPGTNTALLLAGALLANVVGTTGAAMLLIRPFLRINRDHIRPYHVVFFIFIVANCGGALTPIGDPPLFMGFLRGVPFFWVAKALWPMWAVAVGMLLIVFFCIDSAQHKKSPRQPHEHDAGREVGVFGIQNFLFLGLILFAVFRPSIFEVFGEERYWLLPFSREGLMLLAALGSLRMTQPHIHERNGFKWGPILEVAILFLGLFSTMVPALHYLHHHSDSLPLHTPGQYYFMSGVLSAALDNAPTYLVFLEARLAQSGMDVQATIADPASALFLVAISLGSVFFGACTYIGNGPNFMVKSISESSGVQMPSFFGYVLRYTLPILVPIYVLIWLVFFVFKVGS